MWGDDIIFSDIERTDESRMRATIIKELKDSKELIASMGREIELLRDELADRTHIPQPKM